MALGRCPEPEMIQNGIETDHLEHSGGLVPEIIENGTSTGNLEHLGTMGPTYV